MSTFTEQLDDFRREILLSLGIGSLAEVQLPVVDARGVPPIIAALAEERLAVLMQRVRAAGGFANVFVRDGDAIHLLPFIDRRSALTDSDAEDLTLAADRPAPDATVGMFVAYLALKPNGVLLPAALDEDRPVVKAPTELQLA